MKRAGFLIFVLVAVFLTGSSFVAGPVKSDSLKSIPQISLESSPENRFKDSVILYTGSPVALVDNAVRTIEAENLKIRPQMKNNYMMVPVRFIAESLGGKVTWDAKTKAAVLDFGKVTIELKPESDITTVNGKNIKLKAEAYSENGRIYVLAEQIAELAGYKVFVDSGLVAISKSSNLLDSKQDKKLIAEITQTLGKPPAVGSKAALTGVLKQVYADWSKVSNNSLRKSKELFVMDETSALENNKTTSESSTRENAAASISGDAAVKNDDYSTTNAQVEGVDEADIVKTDGEYIYHVNKNRIVVAKAYPAEEMKVVSTINFDEKDFSPQEMYIDGDRLVAIGTIGSSRMLMTKSKYSNINVPKFLVKAIIFDCSDKSNIKKIREVELDGSYVSSRKIGNKLYLVANKNISYIFYNDWESSDDLRPSYLDTAVSKTRKYIDYSKIYCFPESIEPAYLIVASLDIKDDKTEAAVYTCLGSGENIYVSPDNLYVAFSSYGNRVAKSLNGNLIYREASETSIYKFSLENGKTAFTCKGTVSGTILNQFSMDESSGAFRIATTSGDVWRTDEGISKNNVYILDESLKVTGKLENLAPGEKIYSVRFMGDRGYIVTFKTVDPLFVIDLKDKTAPKVLGALKIPGYSDYLHPYDSNHIIGFGKDTVEIKGGAYYKGMKLAMFDVTDVTKPVQMFSEYIGDRGTDSELLRNHKALLFSKERNLMAFPITVMETKKSSSDKNDLQYGSFAFQGAYVYNVDLLKGFEIKGKISHLSKEDYLKSGDGWYQSEKNIERIIYIKDTIYTLSQAKIMANSLMDMKEKSSVVIP